MRSQWESFARGVACPLDAPRPASNEHWDFVATLSVSSLYLTANQTYRDLRHALAAERPR
jgi:hypothetical protein